MDISSIDRKHCTGCGACKETCPKRCISMVEDEFGFVYPKIERSRCVDCGKCTSVCTVISPINKRKPIKVIAAYDSNIERRLGSSSGGLASILAESVLEKDGVVYACTQKGNSEIFHERIDTVEELESIKGSKYVQSDLKETFKLCEVDLKASREVLFIGTPCQIAGLKTFLGKNYDNLVTVDLICHGVPSQRFLKENILYTRRNATQNVQVSFRRKNKGKTYFGFYLTSCNELVYKKDYPNDYFISGFLSGLFFRPNCFHCEYAKTDRVGDITLGDFWGLVGYSTNLDLNNGVSLILINSQKGQNLIDKIKGQLIFEDRNIEEALKGNRQLSQPFLKPDNYTAFYNDYMRNGYEMACKRHLKSYIRRNRMSMAFGEHPYLLLPIRILNRIFNWV